MPHLDAAYNLARWLTRSDHDAEDVAQEAMLRALRFVDGMEGESARAWLLAIVRNTCFTWLKRNRPLEISGSLDAVEALEEAGSPPLHGMPVMDPEAAALKAGEGRTLERLVEALPAEFREVLVLREIEDLSYRELAEVTGVPIGTVMSRLARARKLLRQAWERMEEQDGA